MRFCVRCPLGRFGLVLCLGAFLGYPSVAGSRRPPANLGCDAWIAMPLLWPAIIHERCALFCAVFGLCHFCGDVKTGAWLCAMTAQRRAFGQTWADESCGIALSAMSGALFGSFGLGFFSMFGRFHKNFRREAFGCLPQSAPRCRDTLATRHERAHAQVFPL